MSLLNPFHSHLWDRQIITVYIYKTVLRREKVQIMYIKNWNEASELQAATKELKGQILKAKQAQRSALENKMAAITQTWLRLEKEKEKKKTL